jgi:integrase
MTTRELPDDNVQETEERVSKRRRRKRRDGLRKRCRCGAKYWDGCPHPWHFRIKLPGQKRHRLNLQEYLNVPGVISRQEAEALADRARVQLRSKASPDVRLTLGDVADRFVRAYPDKKHYYVVALRSIEVPAANGTTVKLEAKPMADVTSDDIESAANTWQARAKKGRNGGVDAKRHLLTTARRLFNWAIKQRIARSTPFKENGVAMIDVPTSRQRDRRFVGDEEARLLAGADPYTKDLIVVALETGCRGGELRSLQWHDVQEDLIVLTAEKTKTKRKRVIPVSPTLRKLLDRRRIGPDGEELPTTAHVFGNEVGEPISRRLANRWWNASLKAAKIVDLKFHDLRHEFGSQLLEAGGELHEVQARSGTPTSR